MNVFEADFAQLAEAMQNFFNAVDQRCEVAVHSAAHEIEAFHGHNAALEAMTRACEHLRENEDDLAKFWMGVYGYLVSPEPLREGGVLLH